MNNLGKALLACSVLLLSSPLHAAGAMAVAIPKEEGFSICLRKDPRWGTCVETLKVPWVVITAYIKETGSRDLTKEDNILIFYKGWKASLTK